MHDAGSGIGAPMVHLRGSLATDELTTVKSSSVTRMRLALEGEEVSNGYLGFGIHIMWCKFHQCLLLA